MQTKTIVHISIIAALYAVFTILLTPISYGVVQLRLSEFLKGLVIINPLFSIGIGIGTFFANLNSPMVGPLELIWMPITDIVGGFIAWFVYRITNYLISMIVYSFTTALSVSIMLYILGLGGYWLLFASIFISELIILVGSIPINKYIARYLNDSVAQR